MAEKEKGLGLKEGSRQVITYKKCCGQGFDPSRSQRTDGVQDRDEVGG